MKTKLVKSIMASLVIACGLVSMAAAGTSTQRQRRGGKLEGTWSMQITLNDCSGHVIRSFPTLSRIQWREVTLHEASAGTAPALTNAAGKGVWSHTTDSDLCVSLQGLHV